MACRRLSCTTLALQGFVSLREADYFADHGFTDILYAVGITQNKMNHVAGLMKRGVKLTVILDSVDAAHMLVRVAKEMPELLHGLIEIDCDGHRAGILPECADLLAVAEVLATGGVVVKGVMTHAGGSYECRSDAALRASAEQERVRTVRAARRLRTAGHAAPVVSVGSTPTALFAQDLNGVTEVRVGAQLRILPNHACATGAQHARYHLIDASPVITAQWERFSGW